jgi:hypothetical protein
MAEDPWRRRQRLNREYRRTDQRYRRDNLRRSNQIFRTAVDISRLRSASERRSTSVESSRLQTLRDEIILDKLAADLSHR